jgi:hypothetical protein
LEAYVFVFNQSNNLTVSFYTECVDLLNKTLKMVMPNDSLQRKIGLSTSEGEIKSLMSIMRSKNRYCGLEVPITW